MTTLLDAVAPILALIEEGKAITPVPTHLLRRLADASLPKKKWYDYDGERVWEPWGGALRWRPSPGSKKVWSIKRKNDLPHDIHMHHHEPIFGASCLLEDFHYRYEANEYVHTPSGRVMTTRQIHRLFPPDTLPSLNGVEKLPSLFIRRHNRKRV